MRGRDVASTGVLGLRARPGRSSLTAIGIAIGIAALFAVIGISASSRADLVAQLDALGTNLLQVSPGQSFLGESSTLPATAPSMIRRIGPVQSAAAVGNVNATVRRSDRVPSGETGLLSVSAVETTLLETVQGHLRTGRFIDDAMGRFPTVVLGAKAATQLGITSLADDPQVFIGGEYYAVIGILDPVALLPSLDRTAMVGFDVARERLGHDGTASTVYVRTTPDAVDAVRTVLAPTANPKSPNEIKVTRPSDALAARAATNKALTALLLGLGGVALVVGGVGIANVMVISVLERRGEIGVRRALGATRRHVRMQFIVESASLAFIGGVIGVALGAMVTVVYARSRGWALALPTTAVAGGVGAALVIGALAGLYPATRAARLAPADAVRPA
jgi:putative ABC transport system permease protein